MKFRLKNFRDNVGYIKDIGESYLYRFVDWLGDSTDYLVNRFLLRTHLLRTGLPHGEVHSYSDLVLHGAFNEFVQIVDELSDQEHSLLDSDKEISQLYLWWIKKISLDGSRLGYSVAIDDKIRTRTLTTEDAEEYRQFIESEMSMQSSRVNEETEMLIRLIKIRDMIRL